ncbi:DNA-3-methyladenine glycosylase family protein [Dactylosporangium sp. NPDC048998]|uniref:DNA-3-methyladenine glycosylase family protein n=1 Tax=Dactylosporangium sp. NPDC048998 TaxID=3363976 RepID=UPI003720DD6A
MQTRVAGPYDMARQNEYFGGWVRPAGDPRSILMAFPVEGWARSAAVLLRQTGDDTVEGEVHGPSAGDRDAAEAAWRQALAVLSLDEDGSGYPLAGERDPVIGALQREHAYLRPVLFHSPYEAACAFVIAHRMRVEQGRAIRARIARAHGEAFEVAGATAHAFPAPQVLRRLSELPGVGAEKVARLHGIADAALEGRLDRARLRAMPVAEAYADVKRLRGIGDFFATAIVLRGAGRADALPDEAITRAGIRRLYGLAHEPSAAEVARIAESWRPYRMWCSVLIHATERRARAAGSGPRRPLPAGARRLPQQ